MRPKHALLATILICFWQAVLIIIIVLVIAAVISAVCSNLET